MVAEINAAVDEKIQKCLEQRAALAQDIANKTWDTSTAEIDPMAVVLLTSQMTEFSQRLGQLVNFKNLQEWLREHNLVSVPSRGDGNCGLHTLLPLSLGDPLSEFEMLESERETLTASIRSAIADFWSQSSSNSAWLQVYEAIVDIFDTEPSLANEEPPLPPPKQEPFQTPQKRKSGISEKIDLCTPPRVQSAGAACSAEPPLPPPKEEPPQTPQKRKFRIAEAIDLCTPPRVQSVGAARSAMSQDSKPLSSDVQQQLVSQLDPEPPQAEMSKGRNRRKKQKKPSKPEPEPAEKPDEPEEGALVARPVRTRTVQKRLVTLQDKKLEALKNYLTSIRCTWSACQKFHNVMAVGKHAENCKSNRGFALMHSRLIELKMPECLTCVALLHSVGFDMEKLENLMKQCEESEDFPSPFTRMKRKADSLHTPGQSQPEVAAILDDPRLNPGKNPAQNARDAEPNKGLDHDFCTICRLCLVRYRIYEMANL